MKTSYFSGYRHQDGVSIAISAVPNFSGECYPKLYPRWSFLNRYKRDHNVQAYTTSYYKLVLDKLDPQEVYNDLQNSVLLCWERPGEFCHRRLVAMWIEKALGIIVPEYTKD